MNLWGGNMPSEPSHLDQQSPLQAAGQGRGGLSPLEEGKEGGVWLLWVGAWVGA